MLAEDPEGFLGWGFFGGILSAGSSVSLSISDMMPGHVNLLLQVTKVTCRMRRRKLRQAALLAG